MKLKIVIPAFIFLLSVLFMNCQTASSGDPVKTLPDSARYGGYASQAEWGKRLVVIAGCGDCHTPKKMTARGPVNDADRSFAGAGAPAVLPAVAPDEVAKGTAATVDQTAWIGPWGKSYAANITSDSTGIGSWTEPQFINCLRKGVYMGLDKARPLMPPMPWQDYSQMTDGEIKAIFAYLKSTAPVHNVVPSYEPPVMAKR